MASEQKKKFNEKHELRRRIFKATKAEKTNWRKVKADLSKSKEYKLLKEKEQLEKDSEQKNDVVDKSRPYSLSIAVPGQFLNNAQSSELRAYMVGQVARAATLFCVEEIVIYDESCRMTQEAIDSYWNGSWRGNTETSDSNYESCFHLAKILEYLECPQYLRKALFPIHKALRYAGLLNPLDAQHHLKSDDRSFFFREGIVLKKPVKQGRGPICDIGLEKEFQIESEIPLPPGTRVTVEIKNMDEDAKRYRGSLSSAAKVRQKTGQYWGYSVRIVTSLQETIDRSKYLTVAGVSPRGIPIGQFDVCVLNKPKILLVFGGISGVDAAVESEELAEWKRAEDAFDVLLATTASNGSRSERVEENVLAVLAQVQCRLEQLSM
ncbi:unnamed protein product [Caenorhabditis auriculariae]|uniref:Uncharacterized protein n=1 Tax=Caenorhabditis auriculariae TaxID=2777116 RepID=A0A8S1GYM1_9PELO|nr:unnamed protein product [Caenorhabditis auriculariae]